MASAGVLVERGTREHRADLVAAIRKIRWRRVPLVPIRFVLIPVRILLRLVRRPMPLWMFSLTTTGLLAATLAVAYPLIAGELTGEAREQRRDAVTEMMFIAGAMIAVAYQKRAADVAFIRDLRERWFRFLRAIDAISAGNAALVATRRAYTPYPPLEELDRIEAERRKIAVWCTVRDACGEAIAEGASLGTSGRLSGLEPRVKIGELLQTLSDMSDWAKKGEGSDDESFAFHVKASTQAREIADFYAAWLRR